MNIDRQIRQWAQIILKESEDYQINERTNPDGTIDDGSNAEEYAWSALYALMYYMNELSFRLEDKRFLSFSVESTEKDSLMEGRIDLSECDLNLQHFFDGKEYIGSGKERRAFWENIMIEYKIFKILKKLNRAIRDDILIQGEHSSARGSEFLDHKYNLDERTMPILKRGHWDVYEGKEQFVRLTVRKEFHVPPQFDLSRHERSEKFRKNLHKPNLPQESQEEEQNTSDMDFDI